VSFCLELTMTLFARRAATPVAAGYSVIDEAMVIRGEISTRGTIRIDGRLEGRMHRADTIIVGATGAVIGDIEARELVVGGAIEGNVIALGRVEIQSSASIRGDVQASTMLLHEGGVVHGHLAVGQHEGLIEQSTDAPRLEIARVRSAPALPG
jgi:cytoskeletal protein CcmA (bactofilin family)